jgi:hypothetical protein
LGSRWSNIPNVIGTLKSRYMTYSNMFDCITLARV